MRFSLRHIFLLTGILSIILSFLFFGRAHRTYSLLLIGGLLVSILSYLIILFKEQMRGKIIWTLIVTLSVFMEQLIEPYLIRQSFRIFIDKNKLLLNKVNNIFISKPGDILYVTNQDEGFKRIFSPKEVNTINKLLMESDIHLISKDSSKIFYEVYGMLDVHIGITYHYHKSPTDYGTGFKTYIGKWHY